MRRRTDVLTCGRSPRGALSSRLSGRPNLAVLTIMVVTTLPRGVIERIVEVLAPEEV